MDYQVLSQSTHGEVVTKKVILLWYVYAEDKKRKKKKRKLRSCVGFGRKKHKTRLYKSCGLSCLGSLISSLCPFFFCCGGHWITAYIVACICVVLLNNHHTHITKLIILNIIIIFQIAIYSLLSVFYLF